MFNQKYISNRATFPCNNYLHIVLKGFNEFAQMGENSPKMQVFLDKKKCENLLKKIQVGGGEG